MSGTARTNSAAVRALKKGDDQALLYANDLARLYKRVRADEARLRRLEGKLRELLRVSLDLVGAVSAEAAAQLLAFEIGRACESPNVAIFVLRAARYRLLASHGEAPLARSLGREELGEPSAPALRSGAPWTDLGLGEPCLVVPFAGRGEQAVGLAAIRSSVLHDDTKAALELLARFAGVVLEAHLVEEARNEARRSRIPSGPSLRDEAAVASLRGESEPLRRVRELVTRVAPSLAPVLVLGETGTGKELVARAIHDASSRRRGPFVALNCGALPENLVESEIFGHEAGAFTGAQKRHRGKVELANGGTLFLDELGEMPRAVQVKLLRFLQDSRFVPLGGEAERTADVRIVAATNKGIQDAIARGELREDLVYRLNVFTIELPPLRERGSDAVFLARAFAKEVAERMERPEPRLTPAAEEALRAYSWPGNVRELRNVIERAVILSSGEEIDADLLPRAKPRASAALPATLGAAAADGNGTAPSSGPLPRSDTLVQGALSGAELRPFAEAKADLVGLFEAAYCEAILKRSGGNIARAARLAKIDKKNLHRKIRACGLDPRSFKS